MITEWASELLNLLNIDYSSFNIFGFVIPLSSLLSMFFIIYLFLILFSIFKSIRGLLRADL